MLYYRALSQGLDALPQAEPGLRAQIDARAARHGWPALHADLARVDPADRRAPRPERCAAHPARAGSLGARPASRSRNCRRPPKPRAAFRAEGLRARPGGPRGAAPAHRRALRRHAEGRTGGGTEGAAQELRAARRHCRACAASATGRPGNSSKAKSRRRNCAKPASPPRASSPSASSPGCAACPASSRRGALARSALSRG